MFINKSKTLPEIFEEVRNLESVIEKVNHLSHYKGKALRFFVNSLYNIDWSDVVIPEYTPSKNPPGLAFGSITTNIERINVALKVAKTNPKRSRELVQLVLESVTKEEAQLLVDMFTGKRVEGINKAVFKKVYPEFFRSEDSID